MVSFLILADGTIVYDEYSTPCKVIKANACTCLGLFGVACSPILSVSLEEVGCEPVLNLAATSDEAVSIICTVC
jgi:hypothetical protein